MAIIYRTTDLIPVVFNDDVKMYFSPLSQGEKMKYSQMFQNSQGDVNEAVRLSMMVLKSTLKRIEGVYFTDNTPFQIKFEDGLVSEESLDEVMSLDIIDKVVTVAVQFLRGVPKAGHLIDPSSGNPIEGIEVKKI
jgi:hypothetical protein